MVIYIPSHLEKFETIRQLKALIKEYRSQKVSGKFPENIGSFRDYLYHRSLDPVRKFLMLCIPESAFGEGVNYETMINYYSEMFQSYRGTLQIFNFLDEIKDIMGVEIVDYSYTVSTLYVNFGDITTFDINLFRESALEFFKALFYFQDYVDTLNRLKLELESDIYVSISAGSQFYKEFTVEEVINGD